MREPWERGLKIPPVQPGEDQTRSASPRTHLEGRVGLPADLSRPWAVLAHPHPLYGGNQDNEVIRTLTRRLHEEGWGTLRFNFRGVGLSEGSWGEGRAEVHDLYGALRTAIDEYGARQVVLLGYSFGAWMSSALIAATQPPEVQRLGLVAPPLALHDFAELRACPVDAFIVAGDRDEYSSSEGLHALAESSRSELRLLRGVGHFFHAALRPLWEAVRESLAPMQGSP